MAQLFRDMSVDDCNLRLSSSFVQATLDDGSTTVVLVREVLGYHDEDGYVVDRLVIAGSEEPLSVHSIEYTCPPLGYVQYAGSVAYMTRVPERQTRTGLPAHSTVVMLGHDDSVRLGSMRDAFVLAAAAYKQLRTPLEKAISTPGMWAVGPGLCISNSDGNSGKILATLFFEAGEFTRVGDSVQVTTKHPILVSALLRGAHVV